MTREMEQAIALLENLERRGLMAETLEVLPDLPLLARIANAGPGLYTSLLRLGGALVDDMEERAARVTSDRVEPTPRRPADESRGGKTTDPDVPRADLYGMTEREFEVADAEEILARMPPATRRVHELIVSVRALDEFLDRLTGLLSPKASGDQPALSPAFATEVDRLEAALDRFWESEAYAQLEARLDQGKASA